MEIKIILIIMEHFVFITYHLIPTLKKGKQVPWHTHRCNVPGLIPDVDQWT